MVQDTRSPLLDECFAWLSDNLPTDTSRDALSWGDGRIGNMMFRDNQVVAVLDWEMAAVAPPEVDLGWMCYLHLFFQDLAVQLGVPGLPDMFRPSEVRATYAEAAGHPVGDLTWHIAYAAMRHGVIMRRVTERSIFFGEAERPADMDDLIMHRSTLVGHARRHLLGPCRPLTPEHRAGPEVRGPAGSEVPNPNGNAPPER